MGALHEGHLALIRRAAELASPVVVSIFVNPTQFAPGEDFQQYPRTLDADIATADSAGADIVFAPEVQTVYPGFGSPSGIQTWTPPLPGVATQPALEDRHRPDHFAGVCQVVARLFDLVQPKIAVFGEKDYQQLRVLTEMTQTHHTRWPHLQIVAHPTLREPDGLAMSSRNRYLGESQRERALGLFRALQAANDAPSVVEAETTMSDVLQSHDVAVDYAVVRHAETLLPVRDASEPLRGLIAGRVDEVRLIDNASLAIST